MIPINNLSQFKKRIKKREVNNVVGLLIADYRQENVREHIINYLKMFHNRSGKLIDFYFVGYDSRKCNNDLISLGIDEHTFDADAFESALQELDSDGIKPTYKPMLILVYLDENTSRKEFRYLKKIVIELDDEQSDLSRTGLLFDLIFDIAAKEVLLEEFQKGLCSNKMKNEISIVPVLSGWLECIPCVGPGIAAMMNVGGDIITCRARYKIK